jgi:DHA2 family multidrug resistance protein
MVLPFGTGAVADMVYQGLPYVAGSLSASLDAVSRLPVCYLGGFALGLFLSGWLTERCGWKRLYLGCTLAWTVANCGCGLATSLVVLAMTVALLALAAGGMVGSGAVFLLHISSGWSRGLALTWLAALAVLHAGGWTPYPEWICYRYSWRWGFYLGVPFGLVAAGLSALAFGWDQSGKARDGSVPD